MSLEANIRLQDIARETEISSDKVKYWAKLLRVRLVVRGRIGFLAEADAVTLKEMIRLIGEGGSPKEIADQLTGTVRAIPATPPAPIAVDNTARLDQLEKTMMLLVDKISVQEKEIVSLRSRVELPILLLSSPPRPVKPWQPMRVTAVPLPWYERLWLQMFSPEMLRESFE